MSQYLCKEAKVFCLFQQMLLPCSRIFDPPYENSYLEIVLPNLIVALRTSRTTTLQTEDPNECLFGNK